VLAVGTLEKRKNLELLVRAFARLKRAHPTLSHRLVLCGSKWVGHESVFATIAAEAIGDAVVYLGHAERLDVLYNGASVFVFPSKYEGFGLPPLEAMACGVPVIVSNATSLPEVVGDAALLFEPDSVDGLAEAIGRVLYDPALAAELKLAGVRRAAQFTWEATAVATRKAFDRALGLH
jgi:glycosyltransferase involved in cell wall biosynthesis